LINFLPPTPALSNSKVQIKQSVKAMVHLSKTKCFKQFRTRNGNIKRKKQNGRRNPSSACSKRKRTEQNWWTPKYFRCKRPHISSCYISKSSFLFQLFTFQLFKTNV